MVSWKPRLESVFTRQDQMYQTKGQGKEEKQNLTSLALEHSLVTSEQMVS